ncbi:MAG: MotE family protein [Xanthobacteraceae bacterium]|jgi:flagellar motility protein MotE (MotC chaperone)
MMRLAREFRLVPIVVCATASLLALKVLGLLFDGGYTLGQPRQAVAEVAGEPVATAARPASTVDVKSTDRGGRDDRPRSMTKEQYGYSDITGSTHAPKPPDAGAEGAAPPPKDATREAAPPAADAKPKTGEAAPPAADAKPKTGEAPTTVDVDRPKASAGERAVLESLNQRRQELEARARELDARENLLAAAEKRIETRLGELKEIEGRISGSSQKRDEADTARFKGLITMYESMKAKDAAKIFDRLDPKVLLEVATQMNPRRMSDILAQMTPETAERLTVAIANRSPTPDKGPPPAELPKIEGRPSGT